MPAPIPISANDTRIAQEFVRTLLGMPNADALATMQKMQRAVDEGDSVALNVAIREGSVFRLGQPKTKQIRQNDLENPVPELNRFANALQDSLDELLKKMNAVMPSPATATKDTVDAGNARG